MTTNVITIGTAFGRRMPVEVINRTHDRIQVVLPSGLDAWVKPSSLRRETAADLAAPAPAPVQTDPVVEVGMYAQGENIWKVQKARGSGNLYAKRLVMIGGERLNEEDHRVNWEFEYDPGAIRNLKASDRMTLDEAKVFGIRYGVCCVCGITLKDATSVEQGIGPVCGKRV